MAQTLTYAQAVNAAGLHAELLAAGIAVERVEGRRDGSVPARVTVADGVSEAAVAAVVNAHNATALTAAETQTQQDGVSLADLADQYQTMLARSQQIQATMVGTPTNAQVRDAVKDLAVGMERVLKALRVLSRRQGG